MIRRKLIINDEREEVRLKVAADFEPFAIHLKNVRHQVGKGITKQKTMRLVGSIPITFLMSLPAEVGLGVIKGDKNIQNWLFEKYPWLRASEGSL